jgi:hypothetical protein
MAGEWIKFESSLPEKPETLAITATMGWVDPDLTVGKLMRLFRWFDQQTVDGNAARVTAALLDHVLGVPGFAQAVASVGWLLITEHGVSLSKFDRHNGESAKQRAQTAKRVAKHKGNALGNAQGNAAIVEQVTVTALPAALPKEEKRRKKGAKAPLSANQPTWIQALIDLWHEILPDLPGVQVMNSERIQAANDFRHWVLTTPRRDGTPRASNDEEFLAWTRGYFGRARHNDFIMGRGQRSPEHQSWRCSFEWLLSAKGMQKVIEQTLEPA